MGVAKRIYGTERRKRGRGSGSPGVLEREGEVEKARLAGPPRELKLGKRIRGRLAREVEAMSPPPDWANRAFRISDAAWWASLGRGSRATPAGIRDAGGSLVQIPRPTPPG